MIDRYDPPWKELLEEDFERFLEAELKDEEEESL